MAYTAIFGGTFNPLHIGHYEMLEALQNADFVEKILLMPDRIPPHKVCDFLASDEDRIEMCRIAAADFSKSELCLTEFEREGKSYSYDTVMMLKSRFPKTDFAFVCGGDMLTTLDKWYRYKELIREIPFIAFRRAGDRDFDGRREYFEAQGARILTMDRVITDVSSSFIRKNPQSAEKLVPKKIYDYITRRRIYHEGN